VNGRSAIATRGREIIEKHMERKAARKYKRDSSDLWRQHPYTVTLQKPIIDLEM
jgi:hypothetical protein